MAGKRKRTSKRPKNLSGIPQTPFFVSPKELGGIHHAIPAELYLDLDFLINDLSLTTGSGIELCLRSHLIGVTPPNEAGKYFVVTGLRSWQVYQTGVARALLRPGDLPVFVHPEAIDDTHIAQLAAADTFHAAEMYSLNLANGHQQLVALQKLITDERWRELYGDRPRLSERLVSKTVTLPRIATSDGEKRGRGRPRTRPALAPDRPKRPRGRPRKVPPPTPSGNQGSQPE